MRKNYWSSLISRAIAIDRKSDIYFYGLKKIQFKVKNKHKEI